jgi:hypothetical protein
MSVSTRAAVCGSGEERKECRADLPTEKMAQRRKRVDVGMLTLGSGGSDKHFHQVQGSISTTLISAPRLRYHDAGSSIVRGPKAGPQADCHRAPSCPNPRRRRGCGRAKETRGEERDTKRALALCRSCLVDASQRHSFLVGTTNLAF